MRRRVLLATMLAFGLCVGPAVAQEGRRTPYWASISAGKAMMRTGPGRNYPASWLYVRADLPVRVVETYPDWRKVRDPGGETGWMLQRLLSDTRTALVTGKDVRPLHEQPDESSKILYQAEPGVVGRISDCAQGWCKLEAGGREGYIRTDHIWGVDAGEQVD